MVFVRFYPCTCTRVRNCLHVGLALQDSDLQRMPKVLLPSVLRFHFGLQIQREAGKSRISELSRRLPAWVLASVGDPQLVPPGPASGKPTCPTPHPPLVEAEVKGRGSPSPGACQHSGDTPKAISVPAACKFQTGLEERFWKGVCLPVCCVQRGRPRAAHSKAC